MPHDIEAIIAGVRQALPTVTVEQLNQPHPGDDNGLWFFRLPEIIRHIQLESSTYNCPFIVEHSEMKSSSDAGFAHSIPDAISAVVTYLQSLSLTPDHRSPYSLRGTPVTLIAPTEPVAEADW